MTDSRPLEHRLGAALRPPRQLSMPEWAERYRTLTKEEGCPIPGPYRFARQPLLREISDALSAEDPTERVVVMKCVQFGLSDVGNNWIGYSIHTDPGPILMVQCNEDHQKRMIGVRLAAMFRSTPELANRIGKLRDGRGRKTRGVDAATMKHFPGGYLLVGNARSAPSLGQMPAERLMLDEVDRYPYDIGNQGEPCAVAEGRTTNFPDTRKIFICSSPTIAGHSRIERWWNASDKRLWFCPCPDCGTMQVLAWNRKRSRIYAGQPAFEVVWSEIDRSPEQAALRCGECGHIVEEHERADMISEGQWIPTAESAIKGYHVSALYSLLGLSLGQLAADFVLAKSSPELLKTFLQERLGEPWSEGDEDRIDESVLMARRHGWWQPDDVDDRPGVPVGPLVLTCAVDVQKEPPRLEAKVYGWAPGEEHWSIDFRAFHGEPAGDQVWQDLTAYLLRSFPRENGGRMRIAATCVDSSWLTARVYRYVRQQSRRMRIYAIKGMPGKKKPVPDPVWPRKPSKVSAKMGGGQRFNVGTDAAKDMIQAWLQITHPGPGYGHRDFSWTKEMFEQLTAEHRATTYVNGHPVRFWKKPHGRANEQLDLLVYAYAALHAIYSYGKTIESFRGASRSPSSTPRRPRPDARVDAAGRGRQAGRRRKQLKRKAPSLGGALGGRRKRGRR